MSNKKAMNEIDGLLLMFVGAIKMKDESYYDPNKLNDILGCDLNINQLLQQITKELEKKIRNFDLSIEEIQELNVRKQKLLNFKF